MSLHKEISFESEICQHLAAHGWRYAEGDAVSGYDRARALFPADVVEWVRETQPKAWAVLTKNHGAAAGETLLARVRDQLDQRGTLEVLRQGIDFPGLKESLKLAEFKPALAMNPDILARYAANRVRVVRQVRYSQHHENSIDLVLFLNGIPVATAELKTDFTQKIGDAIDQYRFDRLPKGKGTSPEPLLSFPGGAMVHFAVSNSEVHMVTKLEGPATVFLPFNQGDDGAAGNPVNPAGGHRTAYLWGRIWERESWLEILGRYLVPKRDQKKKLCGFIFPRFHQLDVTRKLQAEILKVGPGGRYLVQHSAGSGKTNSIAWTAHFLAELHDAGHRKVFDSVVVVSDRTVIDTQLQEALFDFQRQTGVVATIKGGEGSKSKELAAALDGSKKIVVCTIQTFPFAIQAVRELAATQGKRFAVIADEAHSSQSGEAASMLKSVLTPAQIAELADGGGLDAEDILAAQMKARAGDSSEAGISFAAFTATPKAKTLELSGTTDPNLVFNLRAKLDAAGCYDDFEVDRVVRAQLDPASKQSDLVSALEPVTDRLMKRFKAARAALQAAKDAGDPKAAEAARSDMEALILFKADMGTYIRLYTFLSQIFDYGNTAIEKRAIFFKRLLPLLEFGREREGIDLSKVVLTYHTLKSQGKKNLSLTGGEAGKLDPMTDAGSGSLQEKEKALMAEIIQKLNDLFEGELTDEDKLVYVNNVLMGKLMESEKLRQQAVNNTKEQFANSPDLSTALLHAIMEAYDAHTAMSTQALNSEAVQKGLKNILLQNAGLWESLRRRQVG